ncbi:DUF433 domain-containing protein [Microvirga sp. P5_D2]
MAEAVAYTAAEAAFVLREPVRAVKKALDDGPVQARLVSKPGGPVRTIEWSDLLYLYAVRVLRDELTPKGRNEFYHALKGVQVDRAREVRFGRLSVAIDDLKAEVEARSRELRELADRVEFRGDGEPVLKNTSVEVHRIAALLSGGLSVDEVREDYPSLSAQDIETARAYAEAHPKTGRPYLRTTAKRALKGAGLESLDEALGDEQA